MVLTVGLTLLGLAAIAVICGYTVPPIPHGPEFDAKFTVLEGFFYADQPAKTMAYDASCVAIPFLLGLSFLSSQRFVKNLPDEAMDRLIGIGVVVYALLLMGCASPLIHCPNPPFWMTPPSWLLSPFFFSHPFFTPARIFFLLMAAGLELLFLMYPSRRNNRWAMVLLLAVWVLAIPCRFYLTSEINDAPRYVYHLNSVLDSLSQSVNGRHLLVDFPHIYGGYGEMLAPIIRFFPREIGTLIAALAIPNILGVLCLLLTAWLVIRRPAILFLCGLALLGVAYLSSSDDLTYGYGAARFFLPPVGLLAATLYFRRASAFRYAVATGVAALASIWNLDSGLVLWGSWLVTLSMIELAVGNLPGLARHLLIQTIALVAGWATFFLYLRAASGQWPDVGLLFYFQKMVVSSGYFCVRLIFPDMWGFVLSIYIIALAVVLGIYACAKASWRTPVMLMIALQGIGIFSYFMGRSVPPNLIAVSYPAVLLAGVLCSEGEVWMRQGRLPKNARFFLLPFRIALLWWAFLLAAALPDLLTTSGHVARHWGDAGQTPLLAKAAFVSQQIQPHEEGVYFLSNHSGIYYYLSDTVCALKVPGTIELLQARDMDVVLGAIRHRQIRKLFVDQNFFDILMYRPEIYDDFRSAISQNYQESVVGPTGRLVLYTPR